jgi:hypothetical protein
MTITQEKEYNQLALFRNSLPNICACTETLGVTLYRMKSIAEKMNYIGPNHINSINYLVNDIDKPDAALAWEDENCPPPNIMTINPENGHAHYLHALSTPVHFNPDSSRAAQRYLGAVDLALRCKLGGDPGYSGNLTKNPLHPHWPTFCFSDVAYDLDTLAAHLDLENTLDLRRKLPAEGLGRNCNLFESLRQFAYRERRKPEGFLSFEFFQGVIEWRGFGLNLEFPVPLPSREVQGIAKSIAKWTWANMSPAGFKLWGDNRRAKSLRVRHNQSEVRAERIRDLARTFPEATIRDIAKMVDLGKSTVARALKNL